MLILSEGISLGWKSNIVENRWMGMENKAKQDLRVIFLYCVRARGEVFLDQNSHSWTLMLCPSPPIPISQKMRFYPPSGTTILSLPRVSKSNILPERRPRRTLCVSNVQDHWYPAPMYSHFSHINDSPNSFLSVSPWMLNRDEYLCFFWQLYHLVL